MKNALLLIAFLPLIGHSQIINTIAGNGSATSSGDGGQATAAGINGPDGLAEDGFGNIFVSEFLGNKIRKISPTGIITTIAGTGVSGYSGDSGPATNAQLSGPLKIFIDSIGNLYISDFYNNCVRKVSTAGIITTVVGNGSAGFSGDGGAATSAQLYHVSSAIIDHLGNMYVADYSNYRIRKVSATGIISTIVGNGTVGSVGDGGPATAATLDDAYDLFMDGFENIYIADAQNNKIRKVSSSGIINTIAGTGITSYGGDGGPATSAYLADPAGIIVDIAGNLYIGDVYNNRIREVSAATGIINTIIGNGVAGFSGDGGPATVAMINAASKMILDHAGNLIISDDLNNRVRIITGCLNNITEEPLSDTVITGSVATFTVITSLSSPIYQWQQNAGSGFINLANVLPYSGVTTNTLTIHNSDMFLNDTYYRCVVTNDPQIVGPHCTDTSESAILIIHDNTSVKYIEHESINIFPNPAYNMLTIQIPDNSVGYVQLINELGQVIIEQPITGNFMDLNLEKYPVGLYIAKIIWGDKVIYRKIIKQ